MNVYLTALIAGAAAFAHCLGMCGAFALHLGGGRSWAASLGRQILWHAGRTATYVFLGAVAGAVGWSLADALPWAQDALTYVTGGVMVLVGLSMLGLLPRRVARSDARPRAAGLFSGVLSRALADPSPGGAFALGLATGFLPCPIVGVFLLAAAHGGSVAQGMGVMASTGAGTVWSLLLLGMTGGLARVRLRRWAPAIGGAIVLLLGAVTMLRGTEAFHAVLGCPAKGSPVRSCCHKSSAEAAQSSPDSGVPCCREHADCCAASAPSPP